MVISSMRSIFKIENWTNNLCLFGLHQINKRSKRAVHIVESKKNGLYNDYSKTRNHLFSLRRCDLLKQEEIRILKDAIIILHPDKGKAYLNWKQYAIK